LSRPRGGRGPSSSEQFFGGQNPLVLPDPRACEDLPNCARCFIKTGAEADRDAHALLRVIPNGNTATYEFGFPVLSGETDFTDDIVSDVCGTSSHLMGKGGIGTSALGKMATIAADATTITDGTTSMHDDGVSGETIMYTATWNLQKM
jgi:hypothetical protein